MAQPPENNAGNIPKLPSAALTAKVIPLEGEAGILEKSKKDGNSSINTGHSKSSAEHVAKEPKEPKEEPIEEPKEEPNKEPNKEPNEEPNKPKELRPESIEENKTSLTGENGKGSDEGDQKVLAIGDQSPDQDQELEFQATSFFIFSVDNPFRALMIRVYKNPNFDRTMMSIIGANCITLALFNPLDPDCETTKCKTLYWFDTMFWVAFAIEMSIKMVALGVCGQNAFSDSKWNKFDAFIVVTGALDFLPGVEGGALTSLRTFRVLRPLRAINKFPRMRVLVKLLMDTIPMLASVGMLCFLIFFVFGILAVQFWSGLFHQRCFDPSTPRTASNYTYFSADNDGEDPYICSKGDGSEMTGIASCMASGASARFSTANSCRRDGPTPFYGAIHYDNIGAAWIVLFQIITLEGWVDQMYLVQGAYSFHTGWIYFCALVVIGSFFAINLALVVISSQFSNTKGSEMDAIEAAERKEKAEKKRLEEEARANGIKPTFWQTLKKGECCDETPEQLESKKQDRLTAMKLIVSTMEEGEAKAQLDEDIVTFAAWDIEKDATCPIARITRAEAQSQGGVQSARYVVRDFTVIKEDFGNFIMVAIALNVLLMAVEHHGQPDGLTAFLDVANILFCSIFAMELVLKLFALGPGEYFSDNFNCFDCVIVIISFIELGLGGGGLSALRMLRLVRVFKLVKFLPELQRQIVIMGETLGSVLSFLLLLALFIFIFAVLGMFIFGNNLTFDEEDEYGKYQTTSRKNFDTILWALVTIFQFGFGLGAAALVLYLPCGLKSTDTNPLSFLSSLLAAPITMQTLTLEDWNMGMYNGVRGMKSQWAALYFILLIMSGNYIMFNLFVAILIDGFGGEEEEEVQACEAGGEEKTDGADGETQVESLVNAKSKRVSRTEAAEMLATVASMHVDPLKASSSEGSGVGSSSGFLYRLRQRRKTRLSKAKMAPKSPSKGRASAKVAPMSDSGFGMGSGVGMEVTEVPDTNSLNVPELESDPPVVTSTTDTTGHESDPSVVTSTTDTTGHGFAVDNLKTSATDKSEAQSKYEVHTEGTTEGMETIDDSKRCFGLYKRDCSLFIFSKENGFRRLCDRLRSYPAFDQVVMTCILLNSITMAIERPSIDEDGAERMALDILGHIFTFIFSVEMIIKVIALGLFIGPDVYWMSGWNKLDGVIVWISWVDLALTIAGVSGGLLSILKICRMFRALRPLRAVSRLPGLKRVVNVLILSLAPIGTTLIIVGVFFFLFAVLGGQIFAGKFYSCAAEDRMILANVTTKADCLKYAGENSWVNQPYNFDHLGNSLMTLFVLASIDGWVDIMYAGVDIVGVDMQPQENNSEGLVLFFILFLLIGGFFIINMFVGVIVENFQKNGAPPPSEGEEEEEPEPEFDAFEDKENYSGLRRMILKHATSTSFETFIAVIIILNVIVMGSEHYDPEIATPENDYDGMSDAFKLYLRLTNYLFTGIFIYELVVKYVGFGFVRFHKGSYPRSLAGWNNFDCFIVAVSILGILIDDVIGSENVPIDPSILKILRILRVARILKLLKSAKELVILLNTVARSLAQAIRLRLRTMGVNRYIIFTILVLQVGNLGLLLFLLFFIYAALGIELFGRLGCTDANPCDGINQYANFKNFGMAMLVLFRLSTGDNWNGMMKDGLRKEPPLASLVNDTVKYGNKYGCSFSLDCGEPDVCCGGCDPEEDCKVNCCASGAITPIYYISFCVLSTFIMLNLVVATLMGELERAGVESDNAEKEEEEAEIVKGKPNDVDTATSKAEPSSTGEVTAFKAEDSPGSPGSPTVSEPDAAIAGSVVDEGPSSTASSQSRVKLDPLPPRPLSPSVFEPFAPETIAHDEPEESSASVVVPPADNSQAK